MQIVGREAELEEVRRFLAQVPSGFRELHLEGEAGIGKSTLWRGALAEATDRGYRVISTRPTEAEARLPFAALNDLLGDLLDEIRPDLAQPQQHALGVALLRTPPEGPPPEPLAISLAVLRLLQAAADERPLIMAIDDIPWLDASSASVLEFVFRRLDDAQIGVVSAERTEAANVSASRLVAQIPSERVTRIGVAPLSIREIDLLLEATLGVNFPPSWLSLLHRASGGNPLYAVELGRAVQQRGLTRIERSMPLPDTLAGLVRDRIDALSEPASALVAHASALSQPTVATLQAAIGMEAAAGGLGDAEAAGVLASEGTKLRFTHPLLAAEAYAVMTAAQRREVHGRLAQVVGGSEEHARHLALATEGRDEAVAQELETAAASAHERGAPDAAADLAERAIALTPEGEPARWHREALAGRYRLLAGDIGRAKEGLERALRQVPAGRARAEILLQLGEVEKLRGDWRAGRDLLNRALEEAHGDARLVIEIKLSIGGVCYITGRDWDAGSQHAADAMRLAEELEDPVVLAGTIGHYAHWEYMMGRGYPHTLERRAAELEPWTASLRTIEHPDFDFAVMRESEGDLEGFRMLHERLLSRAERTGDYSSVPFFLANLARVDFVEGRSGAAADRLERAERLARATGQRTALAKVLTARTEVLARMGRAAEAWDAGRASLELIAETGWAYGELYIRMELAWLEMSRRDAQAANDILDFPMVSPSRWFSASYGPIRAEVLVALGRLAEAKAILDRWDRDNWSMPLAKANRDAAAALVAAADGRIDDATRLVSLAQDVVSANSDRWHQGRVLLIAGAVHRRARRRAKARAAIGEALATFEGLGSELWAKLAREQLAKIGGAAAGPHGLTPTEHEVADLVIEGLTNRQAANRLFMSAHTVEAHLTAIYRKLGIKSRAELGRALVDGDAASPRDSSRATRDSNQAQQAKG